MFSFYNVCFCEAFGGLIHVWHGDRNWSKILYGTISNPEGHRLRIFDSEFLYKSFVINVLQSLQWILFSCVVTIEPCLKFYAVPSQSQFMTLKSRSQTLNFLVLNLYSVSWQLLQSLWLIWIMFSMKGYKILKCSRKEKSISSELPCPATGRIDKLKGFLTKQFQMTASSK